MSCQQPKYGANSDWRNIYSNSASAGPGGKAVPARSIENVNCELVSSDDLSRVVGIVKRRGGNEYELSYRPQRRGTHKLHIRVEGRHVSGSPMTVVVHPKEYTAIRTIEGLKGAWGIAVNDREEIIVVEYSGDCISTFSTNGVKIKSFGSI